MSYKLSDPAFTGYPIAPSDGADLPRFPKSIYVGVTGDVALETQDGVSLTFKNAQEGSYIFIRPKRILATGTTATDLIGLI